MVNLKWKNIIVENFAKEHAQSNPDIDFYVFGHLHTIANEPINDTTRCIVLGDWIDKFSYAVFDGENMFVEQFIEGETQM